MSTSNEFNLKVKPDTFAVGVLLGECRKKKEYIDVQLKIGDKLFDAHRNVLSLHSPVLKAMISDQWSTTKICQLSNEFVDEEIMEDLLNFLYTGEIKLAPDNAYPVCVAAHFLQIPILLEPAVRYLCRQIVADNVLPLYLFAKSRDIELLRTFCLRFIAFESEKVFQDSLIIDFSFQDLKDLIVELKTHHCDSEIQENTFHCCVRWAEKDFSGRSADLPILLESIPLNELSFEFWMQHVVYHPLLKKPSSSNRPCVKTQAGSSNFRAVSKTKQNLVVIGCQTMSNASKTSMLCFDPEARVWNVLPNMLHARSHFAAVVKEPNVVVCGGYLRDDKRTNSVEMFEWSSQTWTELPSLPLRLGKLSMAIHNGQLYVAGGDTDNGEALSTVLCYSFETSEWRYVKSMNVARTNGYLIEYRDYLYAIGGATNTVERYDPFLDEWTMMTDMKSTNPVGWFGAALHRDQIYVCNRDDFQVYDIAKNVWNMLPLTQRRLITSLVSMNDKLLAVGGFQNGFKTSSIIEFDFRNQQWRKFGELPSKFGNFCSLSGLFF